MFVNLIPDLHQSLRACEPLLNLTGISNDMYDKIVTMKLKELS